MLVRYIYIYMYVTDIFLDNGETTGYRAFTCRQNNNLWQGKG